MPTRIPPEPVPDAIVVRCACGEVFRADASHIGRRIRCRCGRTLEVKRRGVKMSTLPRSTGAWLRRMRAAFSRQPRDEQILRRIKIPRRSISVPSRFVFLADRVLPAIAWAYLAVVLLAWAAVAWWGDRWWPATVLLFMGRWVFLLPLALLLPAAALLDRRLIPPLVLAALVCVFPLMGYRQPWRHLLGGLPPSGMGLRVVTFNAAGGATLASQLDPVLVEWGADVVAVQECGNDLAEAMDSLAVWHFHRSRMLCLLSKHAIERVEVMDRSALDVTERSGSGGAADVVRYVIQTPGGVVRVVNLHLETPRKGFDALAEMDVQGMRDNLLLRDGESRLARRWTSGAVAGLPADFDPPLVVMGDFNLPPESRIFRAHWGDLRNAFDEVGRGFGHTRYNGWIRVRIDHVLTDDRFRAAQVRVWRDLGSDHRPLVADLVLAGAGAHEPTHDPRGDQPTSDPEDK